MSIVRLLDQIVHTDDNKKIERLTGEIINIVVNSPDRVDSFFNDYHPQTIDASKKIALLKKQILNVIQHLRH
jgi:hypothetical protein